MMLRRVLVAISVVGLMAGTVVSAEAATKQITCYKGTVAKKFNATKCPAGYTTKPTKASTTTKAPAASAASFTFNGSYSIKATFVWSESNVIAKTVTGTGSGSLNGLTNLSGTGSAAPSSQCDLFAGEGSISDAAGNSLVLKFDPSSQACAAEDSAPTVVNIKATASVKSGTGKFVGASGVLTVKGKINITKITAGTTEVAPGTLDVTGTVTTK